MQMRVDGDDAVDASAPAAGRSTFWLIASPCMKGRVLAHVAEIGRQQHQPLGASAPQRFGGEQQRDEFVVRPVQRGIDDRRRLHAGPTVTRISPSGKACNGDLVKGHAELRGQTALRRATRTAGHEWHTLTARPRRTRGCGHRSRIRCSRFAAATARSSSDWSIGVDAVERLALLDAVADLLEQS